MSNGHHGVLNRAEESSGGHSLVPTGQHRADIHPASRHSLRLRLPLLIAALIVAVLTTFLWLAYREVEASLLNAGGTRAQAAADQLAGIFERANQEAMQQLLDLARDPDVGQCLQDPVGQTCGAARARLTRIPSPAPRRFGLWNEAGTRVLDVSVAGSIEDVLPKELPAPPRPSAAGQGPLQALNEKSLYADAVAEVTSASGEGRIGFLIERSGFVVHPPGILNQLVGTDALIELGNRAGGVWTDISRVVPPPPVDLAGAGVREYWEASGRGHLGALAGIRNTPWAVWVEFQRAAIVAPAQRFLLRMIVLAVIFIVVAVALGFFLSARITRPLHELSVAAANLAAGKYSQPVATDRRDEIGHLGHAFNAMADDIQAANRALRANIERTQFALGAAHMGLWEIDVAADRVHWSDTLAPVFGLTPDRAPRTTEAFLDLVHPEDRAAARGAMALATGQRRADYSVDFRVRWPDGTVRWLDTRARVLYDEDDRPTHVLGVVVDVTERRTLESQLRQAQKLEAIGQLAGGVAHDFNNLLTAILGYTNLVSEQLNAQDPLRGHMDEIQHAAERGAGLTTQLLAFSRQQVLEPALVSLNTLLKEISQLLRRLIGEHIDLVTNLKSELDLVLADRTQLEQVIINLAVNARDAMPAGGKLSIETDNVELDDSYVLEHIVVRPGPYVMLAVSDTGMGIDEETRRRMFDPFFTTKERGKGTGLGLATVYGIVKQSGGYIWVYSEKGHGATFKIYLPRAEGAGATVRPASVPVTRAVGSETVLLVEDESAVRFLSRMILEKAGYSVIEAENPEAAEKVFTNRVALLVSDVIMPGSSGPALFQKLTARQPELKVLYMSGYTDDMIVREGRLAPTMAFLQKPFTSDILLRKVREVLDS